MAYTFSGGTFTANDTFGSIVWSDSLGLFVAASFGATDGTLRISTSSDGSSWTDRTTPDQSCSILSWSEDAALFIAAGTDAVLTSTDAVTWTSRTAPATAAGQKHGTAAYSPSLGLWAMPGVAAGTNNTSLEGISTSPDGITWTVRTTPATILGSAAWSPTLAMFVAVGSKNLPTGYAVSSTDGITWTSRTISNHTWGKVFWSASLAKFVAIAYDMVATSTDGINWSDAGAPATSASLSTGFAWAESIGTCMAVSSTPEYSTTTDFATWSTLAAVTSPYGDSAFNSAYIKGAWSPTLSTFVFVASNASTYEFLSANEGTDDTFWYKSDVPGLESGVDATAVSGASARPKSPRGNVFTSPFGESNPLYGYPGHAVAYQNRLIYAAGDYTVGTDLPTIRVWNGTSDYQLAQVPKDGSGNIPKCVTTMATGDGAIYLGTWDTGTTSSNVIGRVLKLNPNSGQLTNVGNVNALTGYIPWALQFHNGELWVGMHRSNTSAGRIYRIKPDTQTSWTQDRDLTSDSVGPCTVITAFQGKMYFGSAAAASTFAKFGSRDSSGTYGLLYTGTGGTAQDYNGFYAATVFADALYFSYWNPDSTEVSLIKKYDGTTVTTAKDVAAVADVPIIALFVHDGVLYALGMRRSGGVYTSLVLTTPDGATWTDRTGDIPLGSFTSRGVANAFASIAY